MPARKLASTVLTLACKRRIACQLLKKTDPRPAKFGHDVPITDFSGPMLVNEGEQIDRIARTAANLPVTFDRGVWSGWQVA